MNFLQNFKDLINSLTDLIGNGVVNLLMGLVFVFFLISIITFLWKRRSGDGNGLQDARNMLGWSIVAMFVMVSIWGLVTFAQTGLGIQDQTSVKRPVTNFGNSNTSSSPGSNSKPCSSITSSSECIGRSDCSWDGRLGGVCSRK